MFQTIASVNIIETPYMKLKFNQRVIQWLASFWGNLSLAILVSVLASILLNFENFKQSEIWDFLIEMEPMDTPVVLY